MGKGMDGHAGKDLIIKVPCGTLVWRLKDTTPAIETEAPTTTTMRRRAEKPLFTSSTGHRPILRSASGHTRAGN